MSQIVTQARNAAIAWGALTLFAGVVTQLLAAIVGRDARFGEPVALWYGHPLYDPWQFLHWALELAPRHPGIAILCLLLALICVLAAFAVLALGGLMAPGDMPQFKSRRGFCSWDKLGQQGLLTANGLALGAVKRFALSKPVTLYALTGSSAGKIALVGDPRFTDATLIAAASAWPGALVFFDARGVAPELRRQSIVRFAPGPADSASLNPLLAIRGGAHAWADARLLARAMLGVSDDAAIDDFAVLILDQLINAPLDQRNLSSLRARLSLPHAVLTEISAAWPEALCRAQAPQCEIARAVRLWRTQPNAALAHLAEIDAALAFLSDGAFARVTGVHQVRFADLVSAEGPRTLTLEFPRINAESAAPLMAALLAQLVAACAMNANTDHLGRPRKRDLLIVLEAQALKLLANQSALPVFFAHAGGNACRLLVQGETLKEVPLEAYDTIVAIGPQTEPSAETLSKRGGEISAWRLMSRAEHSIRAWTRPTWARVKRPIVAADDLIAADAAQAMVFVQDLPPFRARSISIHGPPATFLSGADLTPVAHDWDAPPACPDVSAASSPFPTSPLKERAPIGANIRAALSRRAPPRTKPKATAP
ncbi:MAG: hypothetical protein K2X34_01865 [Hyphomonadaceae bacterium]|nr:hypothetical protein [Hyphomonadaceae bacterium]MBY0565108.1 hypothetical protein [Hyphomonadaceae bacterium]